MRVEMGEIMGFVWRIALLDNNSNNNKMRLMVRRTITLLDAFSHLQNDASPSPDITQGVPVQKVMEMQVLKCWLKAFFISAEDLTSAARQYSTRNSIWSDSSKQDKQT